MTTEEQHRLMLIASLRYQGHSIDVPEHHRQPISAYVRSIRANRVRHKDWLAEYEAGMRAMPGDQWEIQ